MKDSNGVYEVVVLGGGCFWCTEAVFNMLQGVIGVRPGYAGGKTDNPTYEEVSGGKTGHIEVVEIKYDPAIISFSDILTVFFGSHDPTTINRQGNDVGEKYRSAIFYTKQGQKIVAEKFIHDINSSSEFGRPVVTEVLPLAKFYAAEEYHQDYYSKNRGVPYCELVINPKLEKVSAKFADLIKNKKQNDG